MKVADIDLSKQDINLQEFAEQVRSIMNNGSYELAVTASGVPDFDAPQEPAMVLSVFGAQVRLYIGYNNQWHYLTLTTL